MIPNGAAYENFPPFANSGTRSAPAEAKYAQGMVPADTFPAEWANYFFHGSTAGITRLNADTGSIKKEINSVLEAYNITPDAAVYNQLLSALSKIYPQMCECSTPAATAAKSVALQGNVLKAGNVYVITMTYGNTAANPTLSINSGTAYPLCDANGAALASGAWEDGDMIKVLFTGTKYLMATRAVKNTITAGDKSPINSDAVINYIVIQGVSLGAWMAFEDDQPRNGYLKAGTTFNQSDYPALYNMLGTNVVPERYDHDRLGDWEAITLSTSSSSPTVMPYDGFIYSSTMNAVTLYINGVQFLISDHNSTAGGGACMVAVRKGDSVYISRSNASIERVAYYTHPMFIKAV